MKYIVFGSIIGIFGLSIVVYPYAHTYSQLANLLASNTELMKQVQQHGLLTQNLSVGDTGFEVTAIQGYLATYAEVYPEALITGYFGELTQQAVARYQVQYGLPVTGDINGATRERVNQSMLTDLCPHEPASPGSLLQIVNRVIGVGEDYVPKNLRLVPEELASIGIACVRSEVILPLRAMMQAAQQDGVSLIITSAYRPFLIQHWLLNYWVGLEGESAWTEVAEPGHSEHHLGTAIDFSDASINYVGASPRFAASTGGVWLQEHAHKYGFIMSYPEGKESVTGYTYEPWHWRFVGIELATELYRSEHTLSEYLSK